MVQVKNFFVNYRRRFNIDEVLQEWEAEHGKEEGIGPSGQKPVRSPDSALKVPEEEEEVSPQQPCSFPPGLRAPLLTSVRQSVRMPRGRFLVSTVSNLT